MRKQLSLLSVLILYVVSCKTNYIKPKEICVVSDSIELGCNDERKPTPSYIRDVRTKDICTNPQDFVEGQQEVIRMAEKINKLKADLKRCKAER